MEDQSLVAIIAVVSVLSSAVGFVLGAYARGLGVKEIIAEVAANREQTGKWTLQLAEAIPQKALSSVNEAAKNVYELARLVEENRFINLPFVEEIEGVAEVVGDVAAIVEDITDQEVEAAG